MNTVAKALSKLYAFLFTIKTVSLFFFGFIMFMEVPVSAFTCNQLDSVARWRISSSLCDSLLKAGDNDFIQVNIYIKGLDESQPPEKGAPQTGHESAYSQLIYILALRGDTLVKTYDLRDLNDTSKRLYHFPDSHYNISCQVKVHDLESIAHYRYLTDILPYQIQEWVEIRRNDFFSNKKTLSTKKEYFTPDGRKFSPAAKTHGNHSLKIGIARELFPNGRAVSRRIVY